jgi:hypothetical protein
MVYAGQESATLELVDLAAVVRGMFPLMTVSAAKKRRLRVPSRRKGPLQSALRKFAGRNLLGINLETSNAFALSGGL